VETEEEFNTSIINLSYACPIHRENPNCPLRKAREKEFNDKLKWLGDLSLSTKQTICQYHMVCFSKHQAQGDVE
jgi:hypothetical protein